jgi:type IV pilus assembly protein PilC
MFSSRLPLPALIAWCRALRYGLHAGLSPVKVFRQQAKSGPAAVRPLADTIADRLKAGDSFEDALAPHRTKFPRLFHELVTVGEKAGKLVDVFEELERYFEAMQAARRSFLQALVWPGISYVLAVLTIAILVTVLALLGGHIDPLGLGFLGPMAGVLVLAVGFGFAGAVAVLYYATRDNDDLKRVVEGVGVRIPGLKGAYRSFALQRFSMALGMTHEAGMRADQAVALSFRATANGAYTKHGDAAAKTVRGGKTIVKALKPAGTDLFPEEFLDQLQVGEDSGQISEVMTRVAEQYREEGVRRTKFLALFFGALVYLLVAALIVVMIIRIAMKAYIEPLNDALKMNGF